MIYFVELRRFGSEDQDVVTELRQQMERSLHDPVTWLEWSDEPSHAVVHRADVLLINAARGLTRDSLGVLIERSAARIVVLFGAKNSSLGLPTLRRARDLHELRRYLPEYRNRSTTEASDSVMSIFGIAPEFATAP